MNGGAVLSRRHWLAAACGAVLLPTAAQGFTQETRALFGSPVDFIAPDGAPRTAVWALLETLNREWNAWKPGELTALNAAFAAGRPARVSPALVALLRQSAALEAASAGFFNPALGRVVGDWGFHSDTLGPGERPRAARLERTLATRPSLAQLEWRGDLVASRNPALQLDLGAIGKGAAIDLAFARLRAAGVGGALLNLGGNLAALGSAGGRPWRVGIRDPHGPGLAAVVEVQDEAVVTSGSYERWRLLDGERVTHLIDPHSGRPAEALVSVTVLHRSAALADAAATALLVAGPERWARVAERLGVHEVLLIDRHGRRHATPRLAARLLPGSAIG